MELSAGSHEHRKLLHFLQQKLSTWHYPTAVVKPFGYKTYSLNWDYQRDPRKSAQTTKVAYSLPQTPFRKDAPSILMCATITCAIASNRSVLRSFGYLPTIIPLTCLPRIWDMLSSKNSDQCSD